MLSFTKHERLTLLFMAGVIFVGSLLTILVKMSSDVKSFLDYPQQHSRTFVDINAADQQVLESIPYVGKATARAILKRRREVGVFQSVEDLLTVPGIGPKKLEQIKPYLRIGP